MLFFLSCVCIFVLVRPVLLECDRSKNSEVKEGNIGDVGLFSWTGVLRTKIFTTRESKVALTGIVLVRERYCIGHADDVAKISKRNLEDTTRAMFIPMDQKPWYSKVKDYMMHPEYDFSTTNTIALIELDLEYVTDFPVTPICSPPKNFDATDLYVIGYTDENKLLEKVLYKVNYVSQYACKEFYERQQPMIVEKLEQHNTICAATQNNMKHCEWDNGMVMASNTTGIWTLIGFSLQGPSCSAPSRFIDLTKYLKWIETSSTLEQEEIYRKSGGDTELHENYFNKETQGVEFRIADNSDLNDSESKDIEKIEDVSKSTHDKTSNKELKDSNVRKTVDDTEHKDQSKRGVGGSRKVSDNTEYNEDHLRKESKDNSLRRLEDNTESHEDYVYKKLKNNYNKQSDATVKFLDNSIEMNDNQYDANFRVQRISSNAISINFNKTTDSGDCTIYRDTIYSESMPLRSNKTSFGIVILKIPISDLMYKHYSCVSLEIRPFTRSTYLWYNIKRKNFIQLKKAISNRTSTQNARRYHTKKKTPSDILYLKLKFIFAADFIYLVYGKERITKTDKDKIKEKNFKAVSIKKEKLEIKSDESSSPMESANINVNMSSNNRDLKQILQMNNKSNESIVPLASQYKANEDYGFLKGITNGIIAMYKNYVTVNVFLTLSIIFATVYILFFVFVKKGYVML